MAFIVIDDVTSGSNRVCFYFAFTPEYKSLFAAKSDINGEITSVKSENLQDVIAWVGFGELGNALFTSPKFSKKYRPNIYEVVEQKLFVASLNGNYAFYFISGDKFTWTDNSADLKPMFGEDIEQRIDAQISPNFCEKFQKELEQQKKLDASFKECAKDIKNLEAKIADEISNPKAKPQEEAKDVEEFVSIVQ